MVIFCNFLNTKSDPNIGYMYVNFQQNRVSRSVKNVHTNLFAKKSQVA